MKKFFVILAIQSLLMLTLQAQKVSRYTYLLGNGINVRTEQCWNQVWVSQSFEAAKAAGQAPLAINVRILGNLTSGSSYKLLSSGKEVKVENAKPGIYSVKQTFNLENKAGTLTIDIDDVQIKPQSRTVLSIVLYDYEITAGEKPGKYNGQSSYSTTVERYRGSVEQKPTCGLVVFYEKGKHDKPLYGDENSAKKKGTVKPGTYDALVLLGAPGNRQKVWLENFQMKPDVAYNITINLNAGVMEYAGGDKNVTSMHLYPAGTAASQKGNPAPDKTREIMKCEDQTVSTSCPPGSYDVLLEYNNGKTYQWRKNIVVTTARKTQIN